jgi:hypothetical protein
MAHSKIDFHKRELTIHKAIVDPAFNEKTVLVTDTWDYVDLWLRRNRQERARLFWEQAHNFWSATSVLSKESSPLTSYYCMLNAVKTLLIVKGSTFSERHGVSGTTTGKRTSITNEVVEFKNGGILASLCRFFDESADGEIYPLSHLLYNLVYVHRSFNLSLPSMPELFIPIHRPRIVKSVNTSEAWFCAELHGVHASHHTLNRLGTDFERDLGEIIANDTRSLVVRRVRRFSWRSTEITASLARYRTYHRSLRKRLAYIYGGQRLWYLKRAAGPTGYIDRSHLTIAFAAMHRLSELSRYSPDLLVGHFEGRYNWLLSEFIEIAPSQFIDNLSAELTGLEFMPPLRASR